MFASTRILAVASQLPRSASVVVEVANAVVVITPEVVSMGVVVGEVGGAVGVGIAPGPVGVAGAVGIVVTGSTRVEETWLPTSRDSEVMKRSFPVGRQSQAT